MEYHPPTFLQAKLFFLIIFRGLLSFKLKAIFMYCYTNLISVSILFNVGFLNVALLKFNVYLILKLTSL